MIPNTFIIALVAVGLHPGSPGAPARLLVERTIGKVNAAVLPAWLREGRRKPAYCVELAKATPAYDGPSAGNEASIPARTGVRLGAIQGSRVQVAYATGKSEARCSEAPELPDRAWVEISDLPSPRILAKDFIPVDASGKLVFAMRLLPEIRLAFSAGESLLTANLGDYNEEDVRDLHTWLVFTGRPEHPWALLYSGFHSDMFGDDGMLVLFGAGKPVKWKPDAGNRVTSALLGTGEGTMIIKEAFHCAISMRSTVGFRAGRLERLSAELDFSLVAELGGGALARPITAFVGRDRKEVVSLGRHDRILKLIGYDFASKLVQVKARRAGAEIEAWVPKAALDHLEVPLRDFACCACG